jgi:TetR/AcrR family tetracycline transcriptional repressor
MAMSSPGSPRIARTPGPGGDPEPAGRGPGIRAGLSPDEVLVAAREVAEQDGIDGLTMRRLASALGVAPNTLYSHFADKAALIDAVLDSWLADIETEPIERLAPRKGLRRLMTASRRLLLEHGDALPLLLSRPMRGPNASRLGEATLRLLGRMDVHGQSAIDALRILLTYTFGSAALDAPRRAEADREARWAASEAAFGAREDLPLVSANARKLARPPAESVFEAGLDWLLDGIEA